MAAATGTANEVPETKTSLPVPTRRDPTSQRSEVVPCLVAWRVQVVRAHAVFLRGVDGEDAHFLGRIRSLAIAPGNWMLPQI